MKNSIVIIISIVTVVAIGFVAFTNDSRNINGSTGQVTIENEFETKVVYTTDLGMDKQPLIEDCTVRGGVFNECGSVCPAGADTCASVCAYTCELDQ